MRAITKTLLDLRIFVAVATIFFGTPNLFGQTCADKMRALVEGENYFEHPIYYQTEANWACGQACLFSILKKMGWANPHWIQDPNWRLRGVTPENLIETFRNSGFRSNQFKPKYITDLNDWAKMGTSFILQIYNGLGKHFVVFEGAQVVGPRENDVVLRYMDPDARYHPDGHHREMSFDEFSGLWAGDVIWVQSSVVR